MKTLSNDKISIEVANHGAELTSIMANEQEYLWQGDPKYWGRRSPVLFPIVGRVWDNQYKNEGAIYKLGQHGFARDMDFQLTYEEQTCFQHQVDTVFSLTGHSLY
jgi:galactose mutarotase-like enzyme